jgi:hypothetical protein
MHEVAFIRQRDDTSEQGSEPDQLWICLGLDPFPNQGTSAELGIDVNSAVSVRLTNGMLLLCLIIGLIQAQI